MSGNAQYIDSGRTLIKIIKIDMETFEVPSTVYKIQGGNNVVDSAFYPCRNSIKKVTFQSGSNIESVGGYLFSQTTIESVDFSNCEKLLALSQGIFYNCRSFNSVILPPKLELINKGSFAFCKALSSINIPDSVQKIDDYCDLTGVFGYCSALKTFTISDDSNLSYIGSHAFINSGLESFCITNNVKTIASGIFLGSSVKQISVSKGNTVFSTNGVILYRGNTIITTAVANTGEYVIKDTDVLASQAFRGSHLSKITFAVDKNYIFSDYCFQSTHFTQITLPSKIETISSFCFHESKLTSITLPEQTKIIRKKAFSQCYDLTSITLPDNLLTIESSAFFGSSAFQYIEIPYSVTTIGTGVFKECHKNLEINFLNKDRFKMENNFLINNKTTIVDYFGNDPDAVLTIPSYCTNLGFNIFMKSIFKEIKFNPDSVCTSFGESAFAESTIQKITFPQSLTSIGKKCFLKCSKLTTVIIDGDIKEIPEQCFEGCTSLSTITANTKTITNISNQAFSYTSKLIVFDLSQFPLESIGSNSFKGSGIKVVNIPSTVTTLEINAFKLSLIETLNYHGKATTLTKYLFSQSKQLKEVNLLSPVIVIDQYCFEKCEQLAEFVLNPSTTTICMYAFSQCSILKAITIPAQSELKRIEPFAFDGCLVFDSFNVIASDRFSFDSGVLMDSNRTQIIFYIPVSKRRIFVVPGTVKSINAYAFQYCENLNEVIIPDGVIIDIGVNAFEHCSNLVRIFLPKTIQTIGSDAFKDCPKLSCGSVYIREEMCEAAIRSGMDPSYLTPECINREDYIHYGKIPTCKFTRYNSFSFVSLAIMFILN